MSRRNFILLVFIVAVCFRLLFVALYEGHNYYSGISESYEQLARNFLEGRGFSLLMDVAPLDAPSQFEYVPFVARPVGYALFQVFIYSVFGINLTAVQVVQAFLGALGVILLFKTTELLFTASLARVTALIAALWPVTARFEISLLPDATVSLFLLGSTLFYAKAFAEQSWKHLLVSALFIGLSVLIKPNGALLSMFFAAHILLTWQRHRLRHAALIVAASAMLLIPNIVRNYQHTGAFVPFGLGAGISLWEGLSDFGAMHGTVLDDGKLSEMEGYRNWAYPHPVERERERLRYATRVIAEHPWWYAGVMLRRIPLLFTIHPSLFVSPSLQEFRETSGDGALLAYVLQHPLQACVAGLVAVLSWLLVVLSAAGIWTQRKRWATAGISLVVPLCFVLLHIPQHTESRYFYPAISHLFPLAAAFLFAVFGQSSSTDHS